MSTDASHEPPGDQGRAAFAERIALQVRARYRALQVDVDGDRFSLRVRGEGVNTTLPLAPLQHRVLRAPDQAATTIARYVASLEQQLTPRLATTVAASRLVWCVRSRRYLDSLNRSSELLRLDVAADLVAFVAEELPGSIMRGVPLTEAEAAGLSDETARAAATANTESRFGHLAERIRATDRLPADGWRMSADTLFQSSVVVARSILTAFAERCGGEVLLGVPDRGTALAMPASAPGAARFAQRLTREYREAMNPLSHAVLISDGRSLREQRPHRRRPRSPVMPWLWG